MSAKTSESSVGTASSSGTLDGMLATATPPANTPTATTATRTRTATVFARTSVPPPMNNFLKNRRGSSSGGPDSRQSPYQQLAACAHHRQAAEQADLYAELCLPGRHQDRRQQAHGGAEHDASDATAGHCAGIGDHEVQKDEDLRRREDDPPEVPPLDWHQRPPNGDRVIQCCQHSDTGGQRQPERDAHTDQAEPRTDVHAADEDHCIRGHHRPPQGCPPEVEWFDPLAPEDDEGEDEGDVGRIEDVPAAEADRHTSSTTRTPQRPRRSTSREASRGHRSRCRPPAGAARCCCRSATRLPATRASSCAGA